MSDFERQPETYMTQDGWVMFKPVDIPPPRQMAGGDMLDLFVDDEWGDEAIQLTDLSAISPLTDNELRLPLEPYELPGADAIIKSGLTPKDIVGAVKAALEKTNDNS